MATTTRSAPDKNLHPYDTQAQTQPSSTLDPVAGSTGAARPSDLPPRPKFDPASLTTKTNPAAMRTFAKNLDSIRAVVEQARTNLNSLQCPAGGFDAAKTLKQGVIGGTGESSAAGSSADAVIPGTRKFLDNAINALVTLSEDTVKLAGIYADTEMSATKKASKVQAIMSEESSAVTAATGTSTSAALNSGSGASSTGGSSATGGSGTSSK